MAELTYNGQSLEEFATAPRRCSVCGATRNPDGACSFIECPEPLRDYMREHAMDTRLEHCE